MIEYWKKYINSNILERGEQLNTITTRFMELIDSKMEEGLKKQVINSLLQSYFDDLIETIEFVKNSDPN